MEDGQQLHRDTADLSRENIIGAEVSDQHLKSNQNEGYPKKSSQVSGTSSSKFQVPRT